MKKEKTNRTGARVLFFIVPLVFLVLFLSCRSSYYQLEIEVQEPALITFPIDIKELIIINNTVQHPKDVNIIRTYQEIAIEGDIYDLDIDSLSWTAAISLSSHVKNAAFFDEIFLYNERTREDDNWITTIPLAEEFRNDIFNTQGFDGIVSIDRFLFKLDQHVKPNSIVTNHIDIKAEGQLTCSIYLYNRERPLTTFTISDSLSYKWTDYGDSVTIFKEIPENFLYDLAYNMGEKLAHSIVPSWFRETRIIYAGIEARMQEAYRYSKNGRWSVAESIWLNEYEKKSKESDKGKIANNIALANEMQDRLEEALSWAEKAKEHFQKSDLSKNSHINTYVSDLQKRIRNNQILNLQQFGTED